MPQERERRNRARCRGLIIACSSLGKFCPGHHWECIEKGLALSSLTGVFCSGKHPETSRTCSLTPCRARRTPCGIRASSWRWLPCRRRRFRSVDRGSVFDPDGTSAPPGRSPAAPPWATACWRWIRRRRRSNGFFDLSSVSERAEPIADVAQMAQGAAGGLEDVGVEVRRLAAAHRLDEVGEVDAVAAHRLGGPNRLTSSSALVVDDASAGADEALRRRR